MYNRFAGPKKVAVMTRWPYYRGGRKAGFHCTIESFSFQDENDYEYEIFSIVISARAWGSVILAGKRGSCRHSTSRFSESVVVAGTSYQKLEVLALCNRERS